jgi:uncharacterized protein YcfJ
MKPINVSVLALAVTLATGGAVAAYQGYDNGPGYSNGYDSQYEDGRYTTSAPRSDVAQVTRVEPIIEQIAGYQAQECWNEQVNGYDDGYYRDASGRLYRRGLGNNTSGALLGAVVGGALGNQVGKGDGRTAATIGGAVIGALIGSKSNGGNGYNNYQSGNGVVIRCRPVNGYGGDQYPNGQYANSQYNNGQYPNSQQVVGYRVTYRYAGQTYYAVTGYHPGSTMRVLVDVRPESDQVANRY